MRRGALLGQLRVGGIAQQPLLAQLGGARVLVQTVAGAGGAEVGLDVGRV